jgi:peptidoglycan-associated lipoprotein
MKSFLFVHTYRFRTFLFGGIFSVISLHVSAQLQLYKKGLASFEKGYYNLAIKDLQKVTNLEAAENAKLNYTIAEAFRLSNKWIEAIPYYEKAFDAGLVNDVAKFNYAYALKANENYEQSLVVFKEFLNLKSTDKLLNERANREINTLQIIDELKKKQSELVFQNLKSVNTESAEFSPIIYKGNLVFTASRKDKIYTNNLPYLGLYKATVTPDLSNIGKVELFSTKIFDPERNEGTPAFSPDGKTVIFARSNSGKRKDRSPDVDLYVSRLLPSGDWTEPSFVAASDSASWDGCPAFSSNGNTIYFASNRAGSVGGIDIYSVNMDASGRFGNPKNMGKAINTAGDEMFPYVSATGKLYFASDGHAGLGKLDLFVAVRADGKISVENMGLPYNSSQDDFGLFIDTDENIFFSSNRAGGMGDDDIYFYQAPPKEEIAKIDPKNNDPKTGTNLEAPAIKIVNYYVAGTVVTNENNAKNVLENATLKFIKYTDDSEETIAEVTTNAKGEFGPFKVEEDTEYALLAEKKDFLAKRELFTMYGRSIPQILLKKPVTDTTFYTNLTLDKIFIGKTFRVENIYYDLDKFDIRPDAAVELDKLVQTLLDNPTLKIELGSHTDTRGQDMYNLRLSQKRAESAINYLVSKGIERTRLEALGYGETELLIENAKTEEEHQVNRRTEFKIVEIEEKTQEDNTR